MAKTIDYKIRLAEIAATTLGKLSDEDILHLLAERKQFEELQADYEKIKQEQAESVRRAEETETIQNELSRLNALITPDKADDELIHLIEERKVCEAKLIALSGPGSGDEVASAVTPPKVEEKKEKIEPRAVEKEAETTKEVDELSTLETEEALTSEETEVDREFGREKISEAVFDETNDFFPRLEEINKAGGSIGKILEDLPMAAKKDKLFMLEVAKIDPAYAMHYADPGTLKKDEDFNIRVAGMKNNRTAGSAISEMLPEARTATVVMAAIKSDFRNVRFLLPHMSGYDDMLARAKSGGLQRVKELKDGADLMVLIPKILQKDRAFMREVETITGGKSAS